jgi:pyrroloquinoline quinone biosynthesis protein D
VSAPMSEHAVFVRPGWARLKHCERRNAWLLLVPERVLFPCPITVDILQRIEAPRSLASLARELAHEYDAPEEEIRNDIADLIGGLVEKGYVRRIDG